MSRLAILIPAPSRRASRGDANTRPPRALYLLLGSAFVLVGILALYTAAGSTSFSFLDLQQAQFSPRLQSWVFLAFYVGFGILAGIWPLHTWSPDLRM